MNNTADLQEAFRLSELLQLSILDTPSEPEYDALVQLAVTLFGCAISTVTLIDDTRQWFKAKTGLEVNETPKSISFCQYTIQSSQPMLINDAIKDPRVFDSPLVHGAPYLRAYLGIPLQSTNLAQVGTFCVMDTAPRIWTEREVRLAKQLAQMAEMLIQKHKPLRDQTLYEHLNTGKVPSTTLPCGSWDWIAGQAHVRLSAGLRRTFGLPMDVPVHTHVFATLGIERSWMNTPFKLKTGLYSRIEYEHLQLDGNRVCLREEVHVIETPQGLRVCGLVHPAQPFQWPEAGCNERQTETWKREADHVDSAIECLRQRHSGYLLVDEHQWVYGHCEHVYTNSYEPLLPVRLEDCFEHTDFFKVRGEWTAAKTGLHTQSVFVRNVASETHGGWLKIKPLPWKQGKMTPGHLLVQYTRLQEVFPQH